MTEYVGRVSRVSGNYGNLAPVAVDVNGFTTSLTPSYGRLGSIWGELRDIYDAACRGFRELKEIPGMLYMGKVHGVEHKAKKGKWTERNPNTHKAKMNGNNGKGKK